jgi:nitrate reductase delta subunit
LNKSANIGFRRKPPGNAAAADRLRAWTRERFALPEDAAVMVAEVACAVPGCPPLETLVAFWTEADRRHHFKVFKPLAEVIADDLPPAWLKNALADVEGFGCECC